MKKFNEKGSKTDSESILRFELNTLNKQILSQ